MVKQGPAECFDNGGTGTFPDHPGSDLSDHIGGKPCVTSPRLVRADGQPLRWHDLPIAAAMWAGDGRDRQA